MKVDRTILALGGLYVLVIILYVLFEKAVVNYRPVLMPGETEPEASFPSTHTVLACVIFGSAAIALRRYIKDKKTRKIILAVSIGLSVLAAVGRLISGVHWFTDIIGGLLLSASLIYLFDAVNSMVNAGKNKRQKKKTVGKA